MEKLIAKDYLAWRLGMFLHMSNLFLMLVIPIVVINVKSEFIGVYGATWITVLYAVLFLKMWSYIQGKFFHSRNNNLLSAFPQNVVLHSR